MPIELATTHFILGRYLGSTSVMVPKIHAFRHPSHEPMCNVHKGSTSHHAVLEANAVYTRTDAGKLVECRFCYKRLNITY